LNHDCGWPELTNPISPLTAGLRSAQNHVNDPFLRLAVLDHERRYFLEPSHQTDVRVDTDLVLALKSELSLSRFSKSEAGRLVGEVHIRGKVAPKP